MDLVRERSNTTIDVTAFRRAWLDLNGMSALTIEQVDSLKKQMKDLGVYPTLEYYYYDREQKINDDTRRM